jgi:hypothetical protein
MTKIADDEKPAKDPQSWFTPTPTSVERPMSVLNIDVAIRLTTGAVWVGRFIDVRGSRAIFQPWGWLGIKMRIKMSRIANVQLLGWHSYASRSAVVKRQAARQPAATGKPAPPMVAGRDAA